MLTAGGLLLHTAIPGTYGALLFLLANVFGMFSFIRLFGLASADGRQRLLRRTLTNALDAVATPGPGLEQRMRGNPVLNAYFGQLDEAAARSDGNGIRELAEELATTPAAMNGTASLALHLDVVHRLAKAALVGKLDPVVASGLETESSARMPWRCDCRTTSPRACNSVEIAARNSGAVSGVAAQLPGREGSGTVGGVHPHATRYAPAPGELPPCRTGPGLGVSADSGNSPPPCCSLVK